MPIIEENKPFKNREEVKKDIRLCNLLAGILLLACLGFAALGVITDAFNLTLGLEPMSWLLLAIVAGLGAIFPHTTALMAKHLYGIESE
ncbi:MAG: hypothetical protein NWE90_06115, partial [Candidatus Bathyarchaeota archaeon]|nr:hypothetical protein [Candidatus Bathyarchaeota archaeon]